MANGRIMVSVTDNTTCTQRTCASRLKRAACAKASSQSGASILLALAVVLVCSMVASLVIIAAAANAGKSLSAQKGMASYYAVSSAAQLLADDLKAEEAFGEITSYVRTYACQEAHPSYVHDDAGVISQKDLLFGSTNGATTPFLMIIEEAVNAIDPTDETSTYERDFTIHAPDLDDVQAHFFMDGQFNITVELQSVGASGNGYAATLHIAAVTSEPKETKQRSAEDVHMDGWTYTDEALSLPLREPTTLNLATGAYEPDSNEYGYSAPQTYDVITTTTTVSFTWGDAAITKGVSHG